MLSLAEIRAKLKDAEEKKEQAKNGNFTNNNEPNAFLRHWNMPFGDKTLNLRFLPDGDETNSYFWQPYESIDLPFAGIKDEHMNEVTVRVPCIEMWEPVNSCPITAEVRTWYAQLKSTPDAALSELASKYWKKKQYIFQCFIAPNSVAVESDNPPENPIRRVMLNKKLFEKVQSILMDDELQYYPFDYEHGIDFKLSKTKNPKGYANYDNSQFARNSRPLNEDELKAIETHGLEKLSDYQPKKPTSDELAIIWEMFQDSLAGKPYDTEKYGKFYRPAGVSKAAINVPASNTPSDTGTVSTNVSNNPILAKLKNMNTDVPADSVAANANASSSVGSTSTEGNALLNRLKGLGNK